MIVILILTLVQGTVSLCIRVMLLFQEEDKHEQPCPGSIGLIFHVFVMFHRYQRRFCKSGEYDAKPGR
jgi:hypothetical protein